MVPYLNKLHLILITGSLILFCRDVVYPQDLTRNWQQIETTYTLLKYKQINDLIKFNDSIKFGPSNWNPSSSLVELSQIEISKMVSLKTDAIFERVQKILDMRKPFARPSIKIYSNIDELKKAYRKIYNSECKIRAWYRYRTNTIYINVNDVHAGMVAHELAHAIIDHFLVVKPPPQTAEILARYVDSHL